MAKPWLKYEEDRYAPTKKIEKPWDMDHDSLKAVMVEREARRKRMAGSEKERVGNFKGGLKEAVIDSATVLPNEITLGGLGAISDTYEDFAAKAYERSPVATGITSAIAPNPLSKGKLASKLLKHLPSPVVQAGESAIYGANTSEKGKTLEGAVTGGVLGGAMSGTLSLVGSLVSKPNQRLMHVVGVNPSSLDRMKSRVKDKGSTRALMEEYEKIIVKFKNNGLFKGSAGNTRYNDKTGKWEANKKSGIFGRLKSPGDADIADKINYATEIEERKLERTLNGLTDTAEHTRLSGLDADEIANIDMPRGVYRKSDFRYDSPQMADLTEELTSAHGPNEANKVARIIQQEIDGISSGHVMTAADINKAKQRIYKKIESEYVNQGKPNLDSMVLKRLARHFKETIDGVSKKTKEINTRLSDFYSIKPDINSKILKQSVSGHQEMFLPYGSPMYQTEQLMGKVSAPASVPLSRLQETAQDIGGKIPGALKEGSPAMAIPKMLQRPDRSSREEKLDEQALNMPLSRNPEEFLAQRALAERKIAQMYPDELENFQHIFDNDPDALEDAMGIYAQHMPEVFERDPYKRIGGKIMENEAKARARSDVMQDEDMSYTDKIHKINHLNRTGEFG